MKTEQNEASTTKSEGERHLAVSVLKLKRSQSTFFLESLILAQDERWRRA
ncbi:hypothetical protein [Parageobacillus toebii]|nr:hypothetical protein [Parageobacillus toebii]